jgi:ABC-type dipeptide/oligopeptide/nickel transport system permease component
MMLSFLIAIVLGVNSAAKQYSKSDYASMSLAIFFWSMPWFWYSLMLMFVFSLYLGWLPTYGIGTGLVGQIKSMVLPVIVLSTTGAGFLARLVRSCMLDVLRQDYVRTARSKGLSQRIVIYKHALRNALLPVVTVMGLYLGYMVSGTAVVETVFAYPGIGQLLVNAAFYRDYPMIVATTVVISISVVVSVFLVDILYAYLDPRIRY